MRGAILNPIRFYKDNELPDYLTVFPNFDNTTYGNEYFYGVNSSPDCIREHVGDMFLQFLNEDNTSFDMSLYKLNSSNVFEFDQLIGSVDISPVGWVSDQIHKITLTGIGDGVYYLQNDHYTSDIFRLTSSVSITEDLVKIQYANTKNDFGCIFGTNYFTAYFRGNLKKGETKVDIEGFESDRGNPIKLRATPQRTATLNLLGLHQNYKDLVDMIFSCNDLSINGVDYENMDVPSFDPVEGSDLVNISIKLIQVNNDYYHA